MFDLCSYVFFQAEDGIRDLVRSRGLGDVYKRQHKTRRTPLDPAMRFSFPQQEIHPGIDPRGRFMFETPDGQAGDASVCLLYTSDAADQRSRVDLGGRRFIKKKK